MEKAIKQRLLGGLVLVAGAALFLPMLLDGSGAALTVPPLPAAPKVPAVDAVAPPLDAQVKQADAAVDAAHATDNATPADSQASATTEPEGDVAPDAAAVTAEPARPAKPAVDDSKRIAAEKAAQDKAAQDKAAQEKAAQQKALQDKATAQDKAKAEAEKARLAAVARQEAAKQEAAKREAARQEAARKAAAAKVATVKPVADSKPAVALPEAWVVQVASLSARDKADALVQKLRQKNYRAVLHQQGSVWKVVIGPELRKEVAESIKSRLAADPDLKLSGWVQAYKP
jgi:cell division septation protein DedD